MEESARQMRVFHPRSFNKGFLFLVQNSSVDLQITVVSTGNIYSQSRSASGFILFDTEQPWHTDKPTHIWLSSVAAFEILKGYTLEEFPKKKTMYRHVIPLAHHLWLMARSGWWCPCLQRPRPALFFPPACVSNIFECQRFWRNVTDYLFPGPRISFSLTAPLIGQKEPTNPA